MGMGWVRGMVLGRDWVGFWPSGGPGRTLSLQCHIKMRWCCDRAALLEPDRSTKFALVKSYGPEENP